MNMMEAAARALAIKRKQEYEKKEWYTTLLEILNFGSYLCQKNIKC